MFTPSFTCRPRSVSSRTALRSSVSPSSWRPCNPSRSTYRKTPFSLPAPVSSPKALSAPHPEVHGPLLG